MAISCTVFDCMDPASPVPVGSFGIDEIGEGHFGYGLRYIDKPRAFALDPLHLPLSRDIQRVPRRDDGTYGVLSDAGPNAWGIKLTSSLCRKQNQPLPANPVEWLLHSWHYGSGCLGFSRHHTEAPNLGVEPGTTEQLSASLLKAVDALTTDPDAALSDDAATLLAPGSSLGGVRPKTVVMHDGIEHIAKFARPDDVFDVPTVEYATMCLAHQAGISVPDFELIERGGRSIFLIARFDRTRDAKRKHYLSAHSLLSPGPVSIDGLEYKTSFSYAGIAEAMRPLNRRAQADSHELFRRMVFNILVGNVDDHLRNHAFLMDETGKFVLSPAFDLVPHPLAASSPQAIGVGALGRASTMANAVSQAGRFLLKPDEAQAIIDQVSEVVSQWRSEFKNLGVRAQDIHTITPCFSA